MKVNFLVVMEVFGDWWIAKAENVEQVREIVAKWRRKLKKSYPETEFNAEVYNVLSPMVL